MTEQLAPARGPRILWFAVLCEIGVVYTSLRSGDRVFAAHAATLACLLAMIAWRGEPAWGTRRANTMGGVAVLAAIFLGAALLG